MAAVNRSEIKQLPVPNDDDNTQPHDESYEESCEESLQMDVTDSQQLVPNQRVGSHRPSNMTICQRLSAFVRCQNVNQIHPSTIEEVEMQESMALHQPNNTNNTSDLIEGRAGGDQTTKMRDILRTLPQKEHKLKDKLKQREEILKYLGEDSQGRSRECCANLRHVKWPKLINDIKSKLGYLRIKINLEKRVEGRHGSSVVSYFVFLRWLCFINALVFLLWFCVLCIPQFILLDAQDGTQASCGFQQELFENIICPSLSNADRYYPVYKPLQSSNCNNTFNISRCSINSNGVAYHEQGSSVLEVYSNCSGVEPLTDSEIIVCHNVQTHYEWYESVLDLFIGSGRYEQLVLFYGGYSYQPLDFFQFDIAFIIMVGLIYILGILLLVYKMGRAYNERYVRFLGKIKIERSGFTWRGKFNFSNMIFSAWDFKITKERISELRKTEMCTIFMEEYKYFKANETKRSWKNILRIVFILFWTNTGVLLLLVGAGAAIYYSTRGQLELQQIVLELDIDGTASRILLILVGYITSAVISVLNVSYPIIFGLIAKLELYTCNLADTTKVSMTLIRTILVRLSSLILLLVSLYGVISDCNTQSSSSLQQELDYSNSNSIDDTCSFKTLTHGLLTDNGTDCPECWETYIGQQFYRLALLNLGVILLVEVGTNLLYRCVKKKFTKEKFPKLSEVVQSLGHFNIPKSIVDLIYTQTLMWLGFLFSPILLFIVPVTMVFLYFAKLLSGMYNSKPDKKSFAKSAKTNFLFLFLMLLALFGSIIPVFFAATQLKPSDGCGPFRGLPTMHEAITKVIDGWPCRVQAAIDFFNSTAFVIPFITFLLLVVYAMYVILMAEIGQHNIMKKQLTKLSSQLVEKSTSQRSEPAAHNGSNATQQPAPEATDTAVHRSTDKNPQRPSIEGGSSNLFARFEFNKCCNCSILIIILFVILFLYIFIL